MSDMNGFCAHITPARATLRVWKGLPCKGLGLQGRPWEWSGEGGLGSTLPSILESAGGESGHESGHHGPMVEAPSPDWRNRAIHRAIVARIRCPEIPFGRIGQRIGQGDCLGSKAGGQEGMCDMNAICARISSAGRSAWKRKIWKKKNLRAFRGIGLEAGS